MKLNLIENPNNPSRLWLVDEDTQEKVPGSGCFYAHQFTRPIRLAPSLEDEETPEPDRNLVAALKIAAVESGTLPHAAGGFNSWQEAATFLAGIPDVQAAIEAKGSTLEFLFAQ